MGGVWRGSGENTCQEGMKKQRKMVQENYVRRSQKWKLQKNEGSKKAGREAEVK
jgi:hypothetical protein